MNQLQQLGRSEGEVQPIPSSETIYVCAHTTIRLFRYTPNFTFKCSTRKIH